MDGFPAYESSQVHVFFFSFLIFFTIPLFFFLFCVALFGRSDNVKEISIRTRMFFYLDSGAVSFQITKDSLNISSYFHHHGTMGTLSLFIICWGKPVLSFCVNLDSFFQGAIFSSCVS